MTEEQIQQIKDSIGRPGVTHTWEYETINNLLKDRETLQQQNKLLIEALESYAEPSDQHCGNCDQMFRVDDGDYAREILQQIQEKDEKS